jgi:hypothetical protein
MVHPVGPYHKEMTLVITEIKQTKAQVHINKITYCLLTEFDNEK